VLKFELFYLLVVVSLVVDVVAFLSVEIGNIIAAEELYFFQKNIFF
jgi:hypothetical protein